MSIDLQQFCSTSDDPRYYLHQPFSAGDYTYATNGHILVRVKRIDSISELEMDDPPDPDRVFSKIPDSDSLEFMDLPEVPVTTKDLVTCDECGGKADNNVKCSECGGTGETECFECGNDRECEDCKGTGHVNGCDKCEGEKTIEPDPIYIDVGVGLFDQAYVYQISQLPGAKIAVTGEEETAYFVFDGGDGALMPVRKWINPSSSSAPLS